MRHSITAFAFTITITIIIAIALVIPTVAAPAAIAELVLDVPFATAFVGEPVDCALRIRGPRIDEKIFEGHPEYVPAGTASREEGFVYRFRFVPSAPGTQTVGPFYFGIEAFRLRSNSVEVAAYPKPTAGVVRAVPARARIQLGETVAIRVDRVAKGPGGPRLKPAQGYAVVGSSAADGSVTFVVKPSRTGTITLSPEAFEGMPKATPFWTVPIEVVPAAAVERLPLPPPPRPGEEVPEAGLPPESS